MEIVLPTIIPCQRSEFEIPENVTYYNCAYMSPLAKDIQDIGVSSVSAKAQPWLIQPEHFFSGSNAVRKLFARLVNCLGEDVSILPSVSYGIGIAACNLSLGKGRHVIVLEDQFPSNYYPWVELAEMNQGEVLIVSRPVDGDWTRAVLNTISNCTAIVALPHCHWTDGSLLDLVAIGKYCKEQDIPLVVDATQSLGVLPLDVQEVRPAFLVAAAYKWLLGPYSVALMYCAPEYQNGRPLEFNWITRAGSENFSGLVSYTDRLCDGAAKYDVGERSNFALLPMVAKALEKILDWGVSNISETLGRYNAEIAKGAACLGFLLPPAAHSSPHLLGLRFPEKLPENVVSSLASKNIFVSVRGNAIRVAPHLYNNEEDRARFLDALKAEL